MKLNVKNLSPTMLGSTNVQLLVSATNSTKVWTNHDVEKIRWPLLNIRIANIDGSLIEPLEHGR